MKKRQLQFFSTFALAVCWSLESAAIYAQENTSPSTPQETGRMAHQVLFEELLGKWSGTSRTWFAPDQLGDESPITGEFTKVLDGRFVRHVYEGSMKGKPRSGEEMIAFNSITHNFQISWIDDFHMSDAIMFSSGPGTEKGFNVLGAYDVGEGQPKWGWRTEFLLRDQDHLVITAYNIMPDGTEAKAVETSYRRAK